MSTFRDRRHLSTLLEGELGFYRRLFMLIDRQRDRLQSDPERQLVEDFEAIREMRKRIEASEDLVAQIRSDQEQAFDDWARTPEIIDLQEKIAKLVAECHQAAVDCGRLVQDRLAAYRVELADMDKGRRLLASFTFAGEGPRYVDKRP
ncbi:MAG TPA: hypothetical protein VM118_06730 [Acidobacteriota bacterium]|nr:hypothetical protein [Acidobacteriota bacterium]